MTEQSPIVGDLVEEYREVILPTRGRVGASLWFASQLASLVRPWMWGAAFGLLLGVENILVTAWRPRAEDSGLVLLSLAALALTFWGTIGFYAARRRQRWLDGLTASFVAATLTMVISQTANFIRVLVFYDTLQHSGEWASLIARFHASGMTDLQAFVFLDYARNTPLFIAVFIAVGTMSGALGGTLGLRRTVGEN
jgi:hypothetical protein